jgi:GT2 family glycosyltransferase
LAELSIIIVNYNSADFVLACVRSICEQRCTVAYEVIVVDNASYDGCSERLAQYYPHVIFVQSQSNLGFGRANNLGARHASGEVLLFLNPDTEVRDRAVDCLYEHFQKLEKPGAVGCRLINSDGSLQKSCVQALPTTKFSMPIGLSSCSPSQISGGQLHFMKIEASHQRCKWFRVHA